MPQFRSDDLHGAVLINRDGPRPRESYRAGAAEPRPDRPMYQELKIAAEPGPRHRYAKSREFTAYLIGHVMADPLWDKAFQGRGRRPVFIAYATTRGTARPFTANLRSGERVQWGHGPAAENCLDLPKGSPHRWVSQEVGPDAVVTTAYLRDIFQIDPTCPPARVAFISMPPSEWVDREAEKVRAAFGDDARDAVKGALLAAYIDRRTALPILKDLRFQHRLYRSLLGSPLALRKIENRWDREGICFEGMERCGLEEPVAINASHDDIAALLKAEVRKFYEEVVKKDGKDRKREGGRVLPGAKKAPVQLQLDFGLAVA